MSLGKCELKQWDTTAYLLGQNLEDGQCQMLVEDVKQQEFSFFAAENSKCYTI